jgi:lipopolysaccharide export system permease protein
MLGHKINRMLFGELARVFVMTLTGLTALFLVGLVVQQANQLGLSLRQTLAAIPYLIPSTLPFTIPATTLFAASVAYGRLAHDNEAVALKAAGVNLYRVLTPAVLLGILTTAATFALCHTVIPNTHVSLHRQVMSDPEEVIYNLLKRDRSFRSPSMPYVIHVRDVRGRRLQDVVLKRRAKTLPGQNIHAAGYDYVARAREAELSVDLERNVLTVRLFGWGAVGTKSNESISTEDSPDVEIALPAAYSPKQAKFRISSLTWDELPGRADERRALAEKLERDWAAKLETYRARGDATNAALEQPVYELLIRDARNHARACEVEIHYRPALAVGCLCFALLGGPVGLRANRSDYLSVFLVCFLPAVLTYYPLLLAGTNLAKDGKVPVAVGVWAANAIGLLAAAGLTKLLVRR